MSRAPKYTIIIPIYNAEKTLSRCLDSILSQEYQDIELILVNDGSVDSSAEICKKYAEQYGFIIYIEKTNGGVSKARNTGLDHASGKYILFVDSDDYLAKDYFAKLEAIGSEKEYDFVMFSYLLTDGKNVTPKILKPASASDTGSSIPLFCEALYKKTLNHPPTKRLIRQIIEDYHIRFPEGVYIGEDRVFNLTYAMHCQNCLFLSDSLYYVSTENHSSLSRKIRPDIYEQFAIGDELVHNIIQNADIPEEFRKQYFTAENMLQLQHIYSEAKRMHLLGRDLKFRRNVIRQKCRKNNQQHAHLPTGLRSKLLRIPVRLNLVTVIDLMGWYLAR